MGLSDLVPLHDIYNAAVQLEKEFGWGFKFRVDNGTFETAIIFDEEITKVFRKPFTVETWENIKYPHCLICPDILDFENKIIIEYEEETGNRKSDASYAKKGHGHQGDSPTTRDSRRNKFYRNSGFRFCRIWEIELNDNSYKEKLTKFLIDCYTKRDTTKYEN